MHPIIPIRCIRLTVMIICAAIIIPVSSAHARSRHLFLISGRARSSSNLLNRQHTPLCVHQLRTSRLSCGGLFIAVYMPLDANSFENIHAKMELTRLHIRQTIAFAKTDFNWKRNSKRGRHVTVRRSPPMKIIAIITTGVTNRRT